MVGSDAEIKKQAKMEELAEKVLPAFDPLPPITPKPPSKVSTVQVKKHSGSMNGKFVRGGTVKEYLIIVDGTERWLTTHSIETLLQQRRKDIVIPKGSPYTPPPHYAENERCQGCNR